MIPATIQTASGGDFLFPMLGDNLIKLSSA